MDKIKEPEHLHRLIDKLNETKSKEIQKKIYEDNIARLKTFIIKQCEYCGCYGGYHTPNCVIRKEYN